MRSQHKATLADKIDHGIFNAIYSRSLVYNTCWEDPAVDRLALNLGPKDRLLVITSAGCNVLDYALTGVERIDAVDANPRQTALLELKLVGIRRLEFDDFFALFGRGYHPRAAAVYAFALRRELSPFARDWWDRRIVWFGKRNSSFYFHGLSGLVARGFRRLLQMRPRLAGDVRDLFASHSLAEQQRIYDDRIRPEMWGAIMNWTLSRQLTMSLLGVPYPQRRLVQAQHKAGVAGFIRDSIEYVMRELPVKNNYFWSVYVQGHYTPGCCPEYLKPANFMMLKAGLVDSIHAHTCTVTDFLQVSRAPISRFVLLDHMDWMSSYYPAALADESDSLLARATPGARLIFRSAHVRPEYLEALRVGPRQLPLGSLLHFHADLARSLTRADRVHTYAGFFIADVAGRDA